MNDPLTYEQMCKIVLKGIGPTKHKGAFSGGEYLGNPGKDLYFWIEKTDDVNKMDHIACLLAKNFPMQPPHNPIEYGACVRYIYGCFEKQGILRSPKDKNRMVSSKQDWQKSTLFINFLFKHLENRKCYFGLALLSEQMAHRFGDRYMIDDNEENLPLMEEYYLKAYNYALKCKSKKHLMTTFYWEGRYWGEIGNKEKAIYYYRKAVKAANKYCPDARGSLQDKIMDEFKYLSKHDKDYKNFRSYWKSHATNDAVKKVVKRSPK
jgi:hypothetical protein